MEKEKLIALAVIIVISSLAVYAQEEGVDTGPSTDSGSKYWDEMRVAVETEGVPGLTKYVDGFEDPGERRDLYSFAAQAFYSQDWEGKNLDTYIEIVQAGADEGIKQSKTAESFIQSQNREDYANGLKLEMAVNIIDCWTGNDMPRETRHIETGLKAAKDYISWCHLVDKGTEGISNGYLVKGMYELALGLKKDAVESFTVSYNYAREKARAEEKNSEISKDGEYTVILNGGYLGMAEAANGDSGGRKLYDKAIKAFKNQVDKVPEKKENAEAGIGQLEAFKAKYGE